VARRRAVVVAALAVVVLAGGVAYVTAGGSGGRTGKAGTAEAAARPRQRAQKGRGPSRPTTTSAPRLATTTVPTTAVPTTTTAPTPGTLPQTSTVPPGDTAQFEAEMADLWQGVVSGAVTPALPAFFPEAAYAQLKSLGTDRSDWQDRLVHDYGLDIGAAHRLLGATAPRATLTGVQVPETYAHWITPGVCTNSIGYYEVPNARVVYQEGGATRSFGIASMISWRGQWYVVHLGAILRGTTTGSGEVDAPATGPGSPAYSSTC
jgi:hypothetical protein